VALFTYLSSFFVLVPIYIGCVKYKFLHERKLVFYLCVASIVTEILLLLKKDANNWHVVNLYNILEYVLLSSFYIIFFKKLNYTSNIPYLLIGLYLLASLINNFFLNKSTHADQIALSISSLTFISYSLFSLFLILKKLLFDDLFNEPFFWINFGVLIYFSGNLFIFTFIRFLEINQLNLFQEIYIIHSALNLTNYLFISLGFWKVKK
jgi:hypothetical protein